MNYLVLYRKASGELFYRIRHSKPITTKGSITSMGWKVVDIQVMRNGKIYTPYQFDKLVNTQIAIHRFIRKIFNKNVLIQIFIMVLLYIIVVKLK